MQHCPWSFRTVGLLQATSEKGMPLRCEEISVLFLMRLSRLEQHHNDLSSVFGIVHGVTVVVGKGGSVWRWVLLML